MEFLWLKKNSKFYVGTEYLLILIFKLITLSNESSSSSGHFEIPKN